MTQRKIDPRLLQQLYRENRNIMQYLRDSEGNNEDAILASYDIQAGSYTAAMRNTEARQRNLVNTKKFAQMFDQLGCRSLLHGGTGEAKTISHVVRQMKTQPEQVYGFDISLSRLLYGKKYAAQTGIEDIHFFLGSLKRIPVCDNAFDIVFTSHSVESNGGCEKSILQELYRVCRRYLILREPSYELGNAKTREHILKHSYVQNIPGVLSQLGYEVVEHRLFGDDENPHNQSALTVIRKCQENADHEKFWQMESGHPFVSPVSKAPLQFTKEAYYSATDCLVFPVLCGIPCLLADHGVFSSKYMQFAGTLGGFNRS